MEKINLNLAKITTFLFIAFCAFILAVSIRGLNGNPTSSELNSSVWKEKGPFELSPERGRFALVYSIAEDKSLQFSESIAKFTMPDLSVSKSGKFVSMFAPGVSFLALPGYFAGKYFGISQVGTFAIIALFALLNIILIRSIAIRLGAEAHAANLGALVFAFATPAFAYAVTLYQHHISTFLMLSCFYLLLRPKTFWSLSLIWLLIAFSIVVDNPNVFFMIPVGLYAFSGIFNFERKSAGMELEFKISRLPTFAAVILPLGFLLWFNFESHGEPFKLSGTLESVNTVQQMNQKFQVPDTAKKVEPENETGADDWFGIDSGSKQDSKEKNAAGNKDKDFSSVALEQDNQFEKNALSFFRTRNLTNGFYTHIMSADRGVIWFTPVILIGFLGLSFLYRKRSSAANLALSIIIMNLLLYSMWGDPYGGWAFGSRYLIPAYAFLSLGIAIALTRFKKDYLFLGMFLLVFIYSAGVNTLGALTSDANPPRVEILALEKLTGKTEKYTYERNWQYLIEGGGSKSFVFDRYFRNNISSVEYFMAVLGLIVLYAFFTILGLSEMGKRVEYWIKKIVKLTRFKALQGNNEFAKNHRIFLKTKKVLRSVFLIRE